MCRIKERKGRENGGRIKNNKRAAIYLDPCGPMRLQTVKGGEYFMNMVTAQDRFLKTNVLKTKDQAMECVVDFNHWLDRNWKCPMRCVHAGNAKEFFVMEERLRKGGIECTTSFQYAPE